MNIAHTKHTAYLGKKEVGKLFFVPYIPIPQPSHSTQQGIGNILLDLIPILIFMLAVGITLWAMEKSSS